MQRIVSTEANDIRARLLVPATEIVLTDIGARLQGVPTHISACLHDEIEDLEPRTTSSFRNRA